MKEKTINFVHYTDFVRLLHPLSRRYLYVPKTYGVAVGYLLLAFQAVYRILADNHFSNDVH